VPPNFQRFLPVVLIAVVALFVVPALVKRHTSGPSAGTRATETIDAMNLIDKGEQGYKTEHGRFTPHLADLLPLNTRLASDLAIGLGVQLDVSTNGQRFLA
jgi:competence protein ComGC